MNGANLSLVIYILLMACFFYFWQCKSSESRLLDSVVGTLVSVIIFVITLVVFHWV